MAVPARVADTAILPKRRSFVLVRLIGVITLAVVDAVAADWPKDVPMLARTRAAEAKILVKDFMRCVVEWLEFGVYYCCLGILYCHLIT